MTHFLHHFRRNRTYAKHERWGVVATLFALTLAVSAGGWLLFGRPATSAATVMVNDVQVTEKLTADGSTGGTAIVTLVNKQTGEPAKGVWTGLFITDPSLRTPEFSYYNWYSPTKDRAFFETDGQGKVTFPLMSKVSGSIEYEVYAANPEMENDGKYQDLGKSFIANYLEAKS